MTGAEIAIIATAVAAGTTAYSEYQRGKTAAAQAKQEAAWHDYNARVAEKEAEAERKAAEYEATQHERQAKKLLAKQRALVGASGVTMEGSPLLVMEDNAAQLALENAMIRETGARGVSRWKSQSILDFTKARVVRSSAAGYKKAGALRAGATLLQGASQVSSMSSKLPKASTKLSAENKATLLKY